MWLVLSPDDAPSIPGLLLSSERGRAHGLLERATLRQAVRPRNGGSRLFSVAPQGAALQREAK
jgi:hypothetical protein